VQQPPLAVKVELEQLVLSILDHPSISHVMHKASFSAAVKSTIEQSLCLPSLASSAASTPAALSSSLSPLLQAGATNGYLNPHMAAAVGASGGGGGDDTCKVLDVMLKLARHKVGLFCSSKGPR
jgi:hypothetical protein